MNSIKPRILFVTRYHYIRFVGGAELQCWMMARELSRRGWEVHYASEMNTVPEPPVIEGVRLHGLPEEPPVPSANRKPLRELMNRIQPDVVFNQVSDVYTRDSICEAPKHALTVWWIAAEVDGRLLRHLYHAKRTRTWLSFLRFLPRVLFSQHCGSKGRRKVKLVLEQYDGQGDGVKSIKGENGSSS